MFRKNVLLQLSFYNGYDSLLSSALKSYEVSYLIKDLIMQRVHKMIKFGNFGNT